MSGADLVSVPRDLLASACYVLRKHAPDSNTLARLSELALSPPEQTFAGMPISQVARGTWHPGDEA